MPAQRVQPGQLCIAAALNKVLSYDIIRQTKKIAASFDNDASGVYDNPVPPQAMINCRHLGLPRLVAKMLTIILNNAIYKIRTGHGILTQTYQTNDRRCILDTGQGSCASLSIWFAVLNPMLLSMAVKYTCFEVKSPSGRHISRIGDAYVDDISMMKTSDSLATNNQQPFIQTTVEMEEIAQNFERKLFSTGGSLNLKKCFWYLISYRWKSDGIARMVTNVSSPREIKMTQGFDLQEKVLIHREKYDIAQRTLRIWIIPAGHMPHIYPTVQT